MRNRSNLYYIDKTKHLEEGISRFPSIYIEGNAACGKTTAVEMLLRKYPEIKAYIIQEGENSWRVVRKIRLNLQQPKIPAINPKPPVQKKRLNARKAGR